MHIHQGQVITTSFIAHSSYAQKHLLRLQVKCTHLDVIYEMLRCLFNEKKYMLTDVRIILFTIINCLTNEFLKNTHLYAKKIFFLKIDN